MALPTSIKRSKYAQGAYLTWHPAVWSSIRGYGTLIVQVSSLIVQPPTSKRHHDESTNFRLIFESRTPSTHEHHRLTDGIVCVSDRRCLVQVFSWNEGLGYVSSLPAWGP